MVPLVLGLVALIQVVGGLLWFLHLYAGCYRNDRKVAFFLSGVPLLSGAASGSFVFYEIATHTSLRIDCLGLPCFFLGAIGLASSRPGKRAG